MADKRYTGPVYDIPENGSPVLYYYFLNQNIHTLEQFKKQYEQKIAEHPDDKDAKECYKMISDAICQISQSGGQ